MTTLKETVRAEATQEVADALCRAAGDVMTRHGNDPHGPVIVAAGFALALQTIGKKVDPTIPIVVREMLSQETP